MIIIIKTINTRLFTHTFIFNKTCSFSIIHIFLLILRSRKRLIHTITTSYTFTCVWSTFLDFTLAGFLSLNFRFVLRTNLLLLTRAWSGSLGNTFFIFYFARSDNVEYCGSLIIFRSSKSKFANNLILLSYTLVDFRYLLLRV